MSGVLHQALWSTRIASVVLGIMFGIFSLQANAQTDPLNVTLTHEVDIGFDCPVSATLDPAGAAVWVLMDNCGSGNYSLRAFNVDSGTLINDDDHNFAAALSDLENGVAESYNTSIARTPEGEWSIFYADEDWNTLNLRIPADADGSSSTQGITSDELGALFRNYTEYPETTIYNADHTRAVVIGTSNLVVLDLATGTEILDIPASDVEFNDYPTFSTDGQQLYVAQFNNPDDMDDFSAVLSIYNLPDGDLLAQYDVPAPFLWISPNGQYAALWMTDDQIAVMDLTGNRISQSVTIFEEPRHATICVNDGRDISDVDFTVSGRLTLVDVEWLPDSSGFFTLNSYGGEGAGGGRPCMFNYSRLRHYTVGSGG